MLPDLPRPKEKLQERLMERFRLVQASEMGVLRDVKKVWRHEGHRWAIKRETGDEEVTEPSAVSAGTSISTKDFEDLSFAEIVKRLDGVARQMAQKVSQKTFEQLFKSLHKAGQTVDARGERFGPKHIIETIRRIRLEFDGDGRPEMPEFAGGVKMAERFGESMKEIEESPVLREEFDALIRAKKEEWRDREADRRLVD